MNLPRLYQGGKFVRLLNPARVSLTLTMVPLSSAEMTLPRGENVAGGNYVELFSPLGSAGFFRARSPRDGYGANTTNIELEHAIAEAGDWLVREKIDKMMAADAAVKQFWKHYRGSYWKLGNVSALGSGNVAVDADYDNILTCILGILEQKPDCMMTFDFSTKPWTVNIVKKSSSVTAEARLSRNVEGAEIYEDDSEQCTRVYYQTYAKDKDGNMQGTWHSIDAPGAKRVIERTVNTSSDLTDEECLKVAQTFLDEHKNPRVGLKINGVLLSGITGESLDKFDAGKLLRLNIPEDEIRVEKYINSVSWDDVYRRPKSVEVNAGDEADTVVRFLHNIDKTGKGGKGGGGGGGGEKEKKEAKQFKRLETHYVKTDEEIALWAQEAKNAKEILQQAGMTLNKEGVLIYSDNKNTNIMSHMETLSNQISLVVKKKKKNGKTEYVVDTAEITAAFNEQTGSYIKLSAKNIDLSGYVTMSKFTALEGSIRRLTTGQATSGTMRVTQFWANGIHLGGSSLNKSTMTINGVNVNIVTWS